MRMWPRKLTERQTRQAAAKSRICSSPQPQLNDHLYRFLMDQPIIADEICPFGLTQLRKCTMRPHAR